MRLRGTQPRGRGGERRHGHRELHATPSTQRSRREPGGNRGPTCRLTPGLTAASAIPAPRRPERAPVPPHTAPGGRRRPNGPLGRQRDATVRRMVEDTGNSPSSRRFSLQLPPPQTGPAPTMHRARREASPGREGEARVAKRPLPYALYGTGGQSGPGEAPPPFPTAIEKQGGWLTVCQGREQAHGRERAGLMDGALFGRDGEGTPRPRHPGSGHRADGDGRRSRNPVLRRPPRLPTPGFSGD